VTFQCSRIEWLQQLKAAEKFRRHRHDCSPVVEFATILKEPVLVALGIEKRYYDDVAVFETGLSTFERTWDGLTFGAENTVTSKRSLKNS
jgi:hypothetical protein